VNAIVLTNGRQSVTFKPQGPAYRPEWFRLSRRPMLRFKDHEFLNVGGVRVTSGKMLSRDRRSVTFGGRLACGGAGVEWSVRVARPADGGPGFCVTTRLRPLDEPIEVLEAMSAFELPYEYDGRERQMTVIAQQPVYRFEAGKELNGAGYMHPFWYYGRPGRAHLTCPSASPLLAHRIVNADGSNERCITLIGNWDVCSVKDIFTQPTRDLTKADGAAVFPDRALAVAPGRHGMKFLIGAVNWNNSLYKDPNFVVDPGAGLSQEVVLDFATTLPGGRWDVWLARGWERMAAMHFPADGRVPAWEVARSRGASWVGAAEWLSAQFQRPEGCPGFFNPDKGVHIYAPFTRPKWDDGVAVFCGQWTGPLSLLAHVWKAPPIARASDRLERIFSRHVRHDPEHIWTVGITPQFVAVLRKAQLVGVADDTRTIAEKYIRRRTEVVLNPPAGGRRGDAGILAWDAFANLLAADLFDRAGREAAAKELLAQINRRLDGEFWTFNCAAEGDLVGAGQARPFGHAVAMAANVEGWRRFKDDAYLAAAERFGNLLLGMHYIAWNESPSPDLDTRGWAHGSTGGRDQWAQIPPWETAFSLEQFAGLIRAGQARPGIYDALWLFAHTGLAMFPKARTMKRLYAPDHRIVYRPIESLATERAFYLSLPYLAYENPWDQTMLAGYQGVEPLILSLYLGGGLVSATDDRVLALVPDAAAYVKDADRDFAVQLWNPTRAPVETSLAATVAVKQKAKFKVSGVARGAVSADAPLTGPIEVPPRRVVEVRFRR
jgi:hypothetical protein